MPVFSSKPCYILFQPQIIAQTIRAIQPEMLTAKVSTTDMSVIVPKALSSIQMIVQVGNKYDVQ